jgi:DNA replication protein DnaC
MSSNASLPLLLKQLKLVTIYQQLDEITQKATQEGWGYHTYLSKLLGLEVNQRESKRIERYLKEAKLPTGKFLGNFNFEEITGVNKQQIEAYADDIQWVKDANNIMFFGASGLGKTHLASAIASGLIQQGVRVLMTSAIALIQKLQKAKADYQLSEALIKLDRYPLLIIDEVGYAKKQELETSVLFELIAHRYESRSIMMTSNKAFSQWDEVFPDNMMAVAAIDRLVHHAKIFNLEGESYRKKARTDNNQNIDIVTKEKTMLN